MKLFPHHGHDKEWRHEMAHLLEIERLIDRAESELAILRQERKTSINHLANITRSQPQEGGNHDK